MAQWDSSCKYSPFDASVLERFDDTFVEKLTLKDDSRSHVKEEQRAEEYAVLKIAEKDKVDMANSTSNTKTKQLEEFTEIQTTKAGNHVCAIAFSIPVGNSTTTRCPPKILLATAKQHKEKTLESLNEQQILAEKRRKQQREQRLQRIHRRQETARKLAEKVDIVLQQRALAMGMMDKNITHMPSCQLLATVNQVAHNFRDLTNQLDDDFAVKGTVQPKKTEGKCPRNQATNSCPKRKMTQSISFTVDVPNEGKTPSKTPVPLTKQQRKVTTVEELEEKQRKAEDRRNKRLERRVTRCRENREALMKIAIDIEKFKKLHSSLDTSPAAVTNNRDAALLAENIADGFDQISHRYDEDLRRADKFCINKL